MNVLREAEKITHGERVDQYGKPEDNFQLIADMWNIYLEKQNAINIPLIPIDVAHMMTLFKIARMMGNKPHRDNYVDACGYLSIAADRLIKWEG